MILCYVILQYDGRSLRGHTYRIDLHTTKISANFSHQWYPLYYSELILRQAAIIQPAVWVAIAPIMGIILSVESLLTPSIGPRNFVESDLQHRPPFLTLLLLLWKNPVLRTPSLCSNCRLPMEDGKCSNDFCVIQLRHGIILQEGNRCIAIMSMLMI